MKVFSLLETAIHSPFVLSLGSLGFSVWVFLLIIFSHRLFPNIWLGNLKLNGGPPSKSPKPKPLNPSRLELIPKKSKSKKSSKKPSIVTSSLLGPIHWPQTPSKTTFPSNSTYKAYLKRIQEQDTETLSQFKKFDYEDDEDTTSSFAFQQDEDMCYGLPYTPLE